MAETYEDNHDKAERIDCRSMGGTRRSKYTPYSATHIGRAWNWAEETGIDIPNTNVVYTAVDPAQTHTMEQTKQTKQTKRKQMGRSGRLGICFGTNERSTEWTTRLLRFKGREAVKFCIVPLHRPSLKSLDIKPHLRHIQEPTLAVPSNSSRLPPYLPSEAWANTKSRTETNLPVNYTLPERPLTSCSA